MSVEGKVVVITGGTRGIGRAIAEECVRRDARVVICGRNPDAVAAAADELGACGVPADVSDYAQVESLRDAALERHGRIDAWFNNAGISIGYRPVDDTEPEQLARIVAINLTGHLFGCRAILPYFRERGGYLMNMCGRGYKGEATPHTAAYAATKTAIASLTRSLAEENRDVTNLSVNGFVPGMVETDFYVDMDVSPRLEASKDDWRPAMDAFGVPIDEVARKAADLLGSEPGRETGEIHSLLTGARLARGIAKISWYRATGRMSR